MLRKSYAPSNLTEDALMLCLPLLPTLLYVWQLHIMAFRNFRTANLLTKSHVSNMRSTLRNRAKFMLYNVYFNFNTAECLSWQACLLSL